MLQPAELFLNWLRSLLSLVIAEALDMSQTAAVECGLMPASCQTTILAWTVGLNGVCLDRKLGYAFGTGGFSAVILQVTCPMKLHTSTFLVVYITRYIIFIGKCKTSNPEALPAGSTMYLSCF